MTDGPIVLAATIVACLIVLALSLILWFIGHRRRGIRERLHLTEALDKAVSQAESERSAFNAELEQLRAARDLAEQKIQFYADRFRPVTRMDEEIARLEQEIAVHVKRLADVKAFCDSKSAEIQASYAAKKKIYDALLKEVAIFDERIAFAEMGVYEPHFDFADSEAYKGAIHKNRADQKALISVKSAVLCLRDWTVDGSRAEGKRMTARNVKITLRAFNNECDAAIANCRWNNVNAMEKRIQRAQEQIDKLNEPNAIVITKELVSLKLHELYLTHEHREKLKAEREERAEMARAAREEQKLVRDMERAEEEEARYARLLEKAKAEARSIVGPQLAVFQEQIEILERDLAEAHEKTVRAQALAERTRSGYVYIVSNIGSFGEGVIKIGLTRRLDPMDRVRELGDASVPFVFDTHAIIYSDNAPALERSLHGEFEETRINTKNMRKEFFRASLDDVETAVRRLAPVAPFFKDIEAQEFRETLARRSAKLSRELDRPVALPATI
jgi:hypothetical protein